MSKIVPLVERHRESGWWKPIRKAFGNGFVRFEAEHKKLLKHNIAAGYQKFGKAEFISAKRSIASCRAALFCK